MNDLDNNSVSHLDDLELAMAADLLVENRYEHLDPVVSNHIEECEVCSEKLMKLADVVDEMDEQDSTLLPDVKKTKRVPNDWLLAASVVFLLILSFVVWRGRQEYQELSMKYKVLVDSVEQSESKQLRLEELEKSLERIELQQDSLEKIREEIAMNENAIASLYVPNQNLEEEIARSLRSGNLELTSPVETDYQRNDHLTFLWESEPAQLGLVVYNNQGLKVKMISSIDKGFVLPLNQFNIGMYYYELYYENELVKINKFNILLDELK
ncbi:MAG: hypothetical protein JJ975_08855 [Bacteroidia bacterium]|nr:hypothetical protein [Bacteroidia bacterium]